MVCIMKIITNPSKKQKSYLKQAIKLADQAQHRHKHGAVVVKSGRVVGVGINKSTVHNKWVDYMDRSQCGVHAEVAAMRAAGENVVGSTVFVARVSSKTGYVHYSAPCPNCYEALKQAGVKQVVHS